MISQHGRVVLGRAKSGVQTIGKRVAFRFNGDPKYDEVFWDRLGTVPLCSVGEILCMNGKQWRVAVVRLDFDITAPRKPVPLHHVFLSDRL
jgi:hypothetical protein